MAKLLSLLLLLLFASLVAVSASQDTGGNVTVEAGGSGAQIDRGGADHTGPPERGGVPHGRGIGTPPRPFSGILDTGSDLIWTQCSSCILCIEQPTPYYDPSKSSTSSAVTCADPLCQALPGPLCYQNSCVYFYSYGDAAATAGYLAAETLTFGTANGTNVTVPSIAFGCGSLNEGSLSNGSGMVGFGRGPLSLVNQLHAKKFSYCFTSFLASNSSTLFFGAQAKLANNTKYGPVQSTPFIISPAQPSFFFINLTGVTVGATRLPIPPSVFALNPDGSGGVFIDSGTSITYLQDAAYALVREAFLSQVKLQAVNDTAVGLDVCFALPSPPFVTAVIPKLVLHFGGGADMQLPQENYMAIDFATGNLCLAMLGSSDGSVIGNFQQQNMQMLYDLENNLLSFVPAQCDLV
uniref:Peptidase A1 domain-containing protein n=1 Tax=Ananas comosus var. bracteatus TaxID=296719 RepID=A0A6V7P5Z4_ANACO|nr:unnamed protein product [Ananas comosus var. bracteatus]